MKSEIQRFVRDLGAVFSSAGGSDIGGRIMGWLMICDPPEQSLAEIQAAVGASKASISTMTRMLVESGFIERAAGVDSRRIAFRMRDDAWTRVIERRFGILNQLIETGKRGKRALGPASSRRNRQLDSMIEFCSFMRDEMSGMAERWRGRNGRSRRKTKKRS